VKEKVVYVVAIPARMFGLRLLENLNAKGSQITSDKYAVAVKKDGITVGHLP